MSMDISLRDFLFGLGGTILGGVFVWLVTKNIELGTEVKALIAVTPKVAETISASNDAKVAASQAMERAVKALDNVEVAEREANRIITNINATSLFEKVDKSIEELCEVAKTVAETEIRKLRKEAEGWYVSGINESCEEECAKHEGLTCNAKSINEMRKINSKTAFKMMNASGPNIFCLTYGDDPDPITPFKIISGDYEQCEWRRENDNVTCTAKVENNHMYQRFCYCASR